MALSVNADTQLFSLGADNTYVYTLSVYGGIYALCSWLVTSGLHPIAALCFVALAVILVPGNRSAPKPYVVVAILVVVALYRGGIAFESNLQSTHSSGVVAGPVMATSSGSRFSVIIADTTKQDIYFYGEPKPQSGDRIQWRASRILQGSGREALIIRSSDATFSEYKKPLWRTTDRLRKKIVDRLVALAPNTASVCVAIILGEKGGVPGALKNEFATAGLAHVLVVSGLHVGFIAWLLFYSIRSIWLMVPFFGRRVCCSRVAALVTLIGCTGYWMITGAQPSTTRALLVIGYVCIAILLRRRSRALDALGLAALVIAWVDPRSFQQVGVQLSFTCCLALVVASKYTSLLSRPQTTRQGLVAMWGWTRLSVVGTMVVEIAIFPIVSNVTGQVAVGSPVANLLVLPVLEMCLIPSFFLGVVCSLFSPGLADFFWQISLWGSHIIASVSHWMSEVVPVVPSIQLPIGMMIGYYVTIVCLCCFLRRSRRGQWALFTLLVAALTTANPVVTLLHKQRDYVRFFSIGQGDAALVHIAGQNWLIDVGGRIPFDATSRLPSQEDWYRGASKARRNVVKEILWTGKGVDTLIISHPHGDHYVGVAALWQAKIPIRRLWIVCPATDEVFPIWFRAMLRELSRRGTRIQCARLGTHTITPDISVEVLWPSSAEEYKGLSVNDKSLVARFVIGGVSILFTGDIEESGEKMLVRMHGEGIASDVLKVAHHGSRSSSHDDFLTKVSPTHAVISSGQNNRFSHPHTEVVDRLQGKGIRVVRTDQQGTIYLDPRKYLSP